MIEQVPFSILAKYGGRTMSESKTCALRFYIKVLFDLVLTRICLLSSFSCKTSLLFHWSIRQFVSECTAAASFSSAEIESWVVCITMKT